MKYTFRFFTIALALLAFSLSGLIIANYTLHVPKLTKEQFSSKVYGCIFGATIGDMLGAPVEFISSRAAINKAYPPQGITCTENLHSRDFKKDNYGDTIVPYTDDTGMSIVILQAITDVINEKLINPASTTFEDATINTFMGNLAKAFVTDMLDNPTGWAMASRAPGLACLRGIKEVNKRIIKSNGQALAPDFWAAGTEKDGGCGSVMRAHPFGLIFADNPAKAELWAVEQSKITHAAPIALAACASMAVGTVYALRDADPLVVAEHMIQAARRYDETTGSMLERARTYAQDANKSSDAVFTEFQGWAAHETIAATLYIFLKYPNNLKEAIILGVNTPGDSDSIASMAGALVGARTGFSEIPDSWLEVIENQKLLQRLSNAIVYSFKE